jgi:type I restriction enzyme S subunit
MAKAIVGQANINAREVQTIPVPAPSSAALKAYSTAVRAVVSRDHAMERRIEHSDALFASLQHRAFRGEL